MPYKLIRIFSLIIFLFASIRSSAQSYPIHNYTVADGLPSNTVYCVYKDSKGILWFGTDKGIARYNGIKFEKFSTADGLPDNEIFCFAEDKYNRLWMGTFNGALCYYKDGIIHTGDNTPFLKLPKNIAFTSHIFFEYDGSVTVKFHQTISFINITGESLHLFEAKQINETKEKLLQVNKIAPDKYRLTYPAKTYIWDTSGKIVAQKNNPEKFYDGVTMNDRQYEFGYRAIFSGDRLVCSGPKNPDLMVGAVLEDKENHLFMLGTDHGLSILPGGTTMFNGHQISSIAKDLTGNYWISTTDSGVFCMNMDLKYFQILHNTLDASTIKYARIVDGQLYFSTLNGDIYTLENDEVRQLFDLHRYKEAFLRHDPTYAYYDFSHGIIQKMNEDTAKRIVRNKPVFSSVAQIDNDLNFYYLSSWNNLILDNLKGKAASVKARIPFLYEGAMKNIAVTDSAIYLGCNSDIVYIPRRVWEKQDPRSFSWLAPTKKRQRLFGWAEDNEGGIWFSTVDSLYKVSGTTITAQTAYGAPGLRKFRVWNGFLMGYTHNNTFKICHLDKDRKLIIDTTIKSGSVWGNFYQIDRTHILISTNDKYRIATLTHPGQPNGFHIQTVESRFIPVQSEYVCADSNVTYFFNNGTITRFDTKRLFNTSAKPVVHLISLRTRDSNYATSQSISIPYQQAGNLQLSYIPMSFEGGDLHCEYSISQDSSNTWRSTDDGNIGLYLPHYGTYYLRIRAKTSSDIYSDIATFQFTILKPFWATWWFIVLATVVVLALIWWIILLIARGMLRKRQKAYDADMKYQRMEFKALNALMNPHFIFNTLNNIQNLFKNNGKSADEYFVTFARLIRQNMQNVTKDTISLEQELNLVANYLKLEKLRFDEFVNYKMDVDPELDLDNVFIPPLLIQPLVENSIRHGLLPKQSTDNFVSVHVYEKGKSLFIDIEDNGVGLSRNTSHVDPQHESLGLSNLRKRIEHMNRTRTEIITFDLIEQKDDKGHVKGTLARIEIASDRW